MLADLLLDTVAVPAALTAIALVARAGIGVAVAIGYLGAHYMILGAPSLVPVSATGWLPHAAILAAVASLLDRDSTPRSAVWLGRGAMAVALAWFLLSAARMYQWGAIEGVLWTAAFASALVASLWALRAVADEHDGRATMLYYGVLAAGGALALVFSGTMVVGQLEGGLATAIGTAFIAVAIRRSAFDPRTAAAPVGTLLWAMWSIGFLYAEMPATALLLLLATPAALVAARIAFARRLRPVAVFAAHLAAAAIPVAGANAVAAAAYFDDSAPAGYADDEYGYGYDFDGEVD